MGRSLDEITKILEVVGLEKKRSQVYRLVYIIWAFCLCHKRLYHCHTAYGAALAGGQGIGLNYLSSEERGDFFEPVSDQAEATLKLEKILIEPVIFSGENVVTEIVSNLEI